MRLVSDTGPLLHLWEAGALDLLSDAGDVSIPPGVDGELQRLIPDWAAQRPDWLRVEALIKPFSEQANVWIRADLLDRGEAEAIALARQISADWLLTDDTAARVTAQTQGIEAHGSLGIVLWAAASGHIDRGRAESVLDDLTQSSLWLSARVRTAVGHALNEIYQTR
jgi:predicted nucleic acid-binding protein